MRIKFKSLRNGVTLPEQAKDKDYCVDLKAYAMEQDGHLFKYYLGFALQVDRDWSPEKISDSPLVHYDETSIGYDPTFISLKTCPLHFAFHLYPRSSVWKQGMILTNSVGTVDEGYTGELMAVFYQYDDTKPPYQVGDRVCQMALEASFPMQFSSVFILDETDRGAGGYGSTGK